MQLAVPGALSTPEVAVAGSPVARRLVREVVTGADGLRRVDVIGPGGYGQSARLDALASAFATAGVEVRRELPAPGHELGSEIALLIDDVHRCSPAELQALNRLAAGPLSYLVVAHRPWPRPNGISALGAALAVHRHPVVLDALDRAGVASRATLRVGEPASSSGSLGPLVELVFERTAGLPVLVDRLLDALVEQAGADRARSRCPTGPRPGCWPSSATRWPPRSRGCARCCWPWRSEPRSRPRCWCPCSVWPARRSWTSCWRPRGPPAC